MGVTEKAKKLADTALAKVGEYAEVARQKAPFVIDRAAEAAGKAVDAASAGLDRATRGRYRDRIESIHSKVDEALERTRSAAGPSSTHSAPGASGTDGAGPRRNSEGPTTT